MPKGRNTAATPPHGDKAYRADSPEVGERLGVRLRSLRRAKDLTATEVAERADITRTHLSRIENGHISPTVSTLSRIARAVGEPISTFFGDDGDSQPVVRKKDRRMIRNRGVLDYLLTPRHAARLEVFETVVAPSAESGSNLYAHPADEECLVVTSGALTIWLDGASFDLAAGDAITFSGRTPHRFKNQGQEPAVLIWIVTPAGGY